MIACYLGEFHRAYPAIDLDLVSVNIRDIGEPMAAQDIDIGLVKGPVEERKHRCRAVADRRYGVIFAPEHAFASTTEPIDPKQLDNEVIILREPGSGSREVVTQALTAVASNHCRPWKRQYRCNQASGCCRD